MSSKVISLISVTFLIFFNTDLLPQEYGKGLILDDEYYKDVPRAVSLVRSDYSNLPSSFSLKMFAPNPGSQGNQYTCAGWACGYAASTLLEAISNRWYKELIDSNTFSPSFVYNLIRKDSTCSRGTSLTEAVSVLVDYGNVKFSDFGYECARNVLDSDKAKATKYKIKDFRLVFSKDDSNKIDPVRKSLSEYKPVVTAFVCPTSFHAAKDVWEPEHSDYNKTHNGHALVIVGYDDNKFGGAFEIMNSWGDNWANNGFTWIKYTDFQHFNYYGYELIREFQIRPNEVDLSGSLVFVKENDQVMEVQFNGNYFEMKEPYSSGTMFELFISNSQPAYIYSFSIDLSKNISKIFPPEDNISALLPYENNNVAIPDQNTYFMLDDQVGKTYFCFLYSNQKIDIDAVVDKLRDLSSNIWENINLVLSDYIIDRSNIEFRGSKKIEFNAISSGKSVVAIVVEIDHKQ